MVHGNSEWTLCYWVRGTPPASYATIDVSPQTTINEFRKRIVEANALSVASTSINIYKVPDGNPVLDDDTMEDVLGDLSISRLSEPLRATRALSTYFQPPILNDRLHLVIDVVDVRCWLRGANNTDSFVVPGVHGMVDDLKRNIKNEDPRLASIPAARIRLYKISWEDDELTECLHAWGEGQLLNGAHSMQMVFDDVPFRERPRIVVEWTDEETSKPPPSIRRFMGDGNLITEARNTFLGHCAKESPSSSGTSSSFKIRQTGPKFIPCGRPRDLEHQFEDTIPPTLLHEVFGQFVDDCRNIVVEAKDDRFAFELEMAMSKLYGSENERVEGVNEVLRRNRIYFNISKIAKSNFLTDGTISINEHSYAIAEFKNEIGHTGAEPYFQAIGYYLESTRDVATKYPNSPLPCVLMLAFGPYMVFAAAAWNLRPVVQVLSTPVAFHFHPSDTDNHLNVARHMAAFRKALSSLDEYYRGLSTFSAPTTDMRLLSQLFPHKTSYHSLKDKATRAFEYEGEVVEKKLVFFATEHDTKERICVKFTRTYSREAHECLASLGHAPALRGLEQLPGGWIMVVLDALTEFETLAQCKHPLAGPVFDDICKTFGKFHEAGFVHGDVRDVNIMVSKRDAREFMMIDFDWAGRMGEARYPAGVNIETIVRSPDVLDRKLIEKEHDIFMLDRLKHQ